MEHSHETDGEGQGGGSGGLTGNEASVDPPREAWRSDAPPPGPHGEDDWDAKPADEEFYPPHDDQDAGRGYAGDRDADPGETEGGPGRPHGS